MSRLTLDDVDDLRATSAPLSTQVAGFVSSESFKSVYNMSKPESSSMRYHFSHEASGFCGSVLKQTANKSAIHRVIPLGTGRPGAELYPWRATASEVLPLPSDYTSTSVIPDVEARGRAGYSNIMSPTAQETHNSTINATQTGLPETKSLKATQRTLHSTEELSPPTSQYSIPQALNYGNAAGSQPLVRFLTEHVELTHNPPYRNWSTCLTSGTTSALYILLRMLCNPGDNVLTERYTYPGTIELAQLLRINIRGIDMDDDGLDPVELSRVLTDWNLSCQHHGESTPPPRPRILYMIPSGQNPTGRTQSLQRRIAIYNLAKEHDLLIIEDDPYYFLPLTKTTTSTSPASSSPSASSTPPCSTTTASPPSPAITIDPSSQQQQQSLSYLSLDTSALVLRLDSTSKILAPGLRAGWLTASSVIIDKFLAYAEVSTVAVSGATQFMLYRLFEGHWGGGGDGSQGHRGLQHWLTWLAGQYSRRMDVLVGACEKCLKGLPDIRVSWEMPRCGMFLWIEVAIPQQEQPEQPSQQAPLPSYHRPVPTITAAKLVNQPRRAHQVTLQNRIVERALHSGVQILSVDMFDTDTNIDGVREGEEHIYFRLTTAAAKDGEIEEGVRIFAGVLREVLMVRRDGVRGEGEG